MLYHRRHGISLHRVMKMDTGRQMPAQKCDPLGNQAPIISIERGSAYPLGQPGKRYGSNMEATIKNRKLDRGGMLWPGIVHVPDSIEVSCQAWARSLRSILPLGLRGRLPSLHSIRTGTI